MNNKYIGWILCSLLIFSSCKKTEVNFSFSPSSPVAGEVVTFTNLTQNGDEYQWTFGDNAESTVSSPNHTYKKAGTYIVTLTETKKHKSCTHTVTVKDTKPYIYTSADSVRYYTPVTFRAYIYNPFSYKMTYQWELDSSAVVLSKSTTESTIQVYFTQLGTTNVRLTVLRNGETIVIENPFVVHQKAAPALLCRNAEGDYAQRIYGDYFEKPYLSAVAARKTLLDNAQDTVAQYGSRLLTRSTLNIASHPSVEGFQIDAEAQKIYFRDNGLFICNINGQNVVQMDAAPCLALCVDVEIGCIYWSTENEVKYMPLILQQDNKYTTIPATFNTLPSVQKLAKDNQKR